MTTHARQAAFWNHYTIYDTHHREDTPKRSEKRRRTNRITVRLLPAERAALELAAKQSGMSPSEFIRLSALRRARHTTSDTTVSTTSEDQ